MGHTGVTPEPGPDIPPTGVRGEPWRALPAVLGVRLREELTSIADEIYDAIVREVREYSGPTPLVLRAGVRRGVEQTLLHFVGLVLTPDASQQESLAVFRSLGRGEWHDGRSLEALQAAFRIGARVGWRRYVKVAFEISLSNSLMGLLAESVFAQIDQVTAEAVRGYTDAQASAARSLHRRRGRLLAALLAGRAPRSSAESVGELAEVAGWTLPATVMCVALHDGDHPEADHGDRGDPGERRDHRDRSDHWDLDDRQAFGGRAVDEPDHGGDHDEWRAPLLESAVLAGRWRGQPCLIVPEPHEPGRLAALGRRLEGYHAVAGPVVPLRRAAHSLRWARLVLQWRLADGAAPRELVFCEDHLSTVMLLADPDLLRVLAEQRLAPLRGLTRLQRLRMEETLLAWLSSTGRGAPEIAVRLSIHPQTARYRMRQLERLLGDRLHDPEFQFDAELALRARFLSHRTLTSEVPVSRDGGPDPVPEDEAS